ncbi:MAG: alanine racemase [Burkholderia sp.]|nr:alanine racemase [Burkholderia sp.]
MPRPIHATIHSSALSNNLSIVRQYASHSKVLSIVKANAYGHGIARVFPSLCTTDGFGLLDLDEAVKIRELGWAGPILLLEGFFNLSDLKIIDHYALTTIVHCEEQIRMIEIAKLKKPINIQLKMNSGMNRLGFTPNNFYRVWERIRICPAVDEIGLITHFSDADRVCGTSRQMEEFERGAEHITGTRSLANSASILWHPETHFDWVRPGIILYGGSPSGLFSDIERYGLKPAMTLASELIAVQTIKQGQTVGYGSIFLARDVMRIGVVACGYADGYPRVAPEGTPVMVNGIRTRVIGRVSMDMLTVELTSCPIASVGSRVELWGNMLSIDEVARYCGTTGYELMCALSARVPVYLE